MDDDNLFSNIQQSLHFLQNGRSSDQFYREKKSATIRRLKYYTNQLQCVELRDILYQKLKQFERFD